jgi:Na+-driven multidrug efflux pump
MARPPVDPATQARGLKILAAVLVMAGLMVGVGIPALFTAFRIEVAMTSWGFDAIWFVMLAMMFADFGMAWYFWRRATAIDRELQGLPPRA